MPKDDRSFLKVIYIEYATDENSRYQISGFSRLFQTFKIVQD